MDMRVYDVNERLFNHNGIKALHPLFAEVTKIDNGDYYVELEDTLENLEYYQKGMIVRIDTPWGLQGFRCDNPLVKNNRVSCKAWHLTYDAKNYLIKDSNAVEKNCNDALNHFNDNTDIASPFTVSSDIASVTSTRAIRTSLFEIFERFVGADKYGGHWYRDNFNFGIKANIGQDRGVVLAYQKNITDIQIEEKWDDVCTKILPYTTDGEVAIELDETYVEVAEQLYDVPYTKTIKFENIYKKDEFATEKEFLNATKQWLKEQAKLYVEKNKVPQVNYSVSAKLENVSDVGDVLYVRHPKVKVDIVTNVIAVKYDAIKKRYNRIEFGNFKKEIKNLQQEIVAKVEKNTDEKIEANNTVMEAKLVKATTGINGVYGRSYVQYDGNEMLVLDKLPKEDAVNCIKINSAGIGISNTGINGTFNSAWTIDGTLNMQMLNVINLTASMIKGGVLKLGGTGNSSGTFELYDNSNRLISLMDSAGLTVYATNGTYVRLNAEVGFAGYNKNGEKIFGADGDVFKMKNAEIENQIKIAGKIKIVPVSTSANVGVGFVALV